MREILAVTDGPIRGETLSGGVSVYRGIPYARPPVGELRWRGPQSPVRWAHVRDCTRFGPAPVQPAYSASPLPLAEEARSENCLYLNVWTPAASDSGRLPVIVWFHPGAYQMGSGSQPLWSGEAWAREGVVFVTFSHRLGRIGFLAHSDLGREDSEGGSGNYGLMDQITVLRWVRDNIERFGGDPGCVTLFGISSGASSVSLLMASPVAAGLFHRAIAESGGSFGPTGQTCGIGDRWQALAGAIAAGEVWAHAIGANDVSALRRTRAEDLLGNKAGLQGLFEAARPIIDGRLVPEATFLRFACGQQAKVPLLTGTAATETMTLNDGRHFADRANNAKLEFGADAAGFLDLYPASDDDEAEAVDRIADGDRLFRWQNHVMARLHASAGHPTYYYRFDYAPPVEGQRSTGAFHASSIFYGFGTFRLRPRWGWSDCDISVATAMRRSWISFARSGNPNCEAMPEWPRFDTGAPCRMHIGTRSEVREIPTDERLRFWDRHYEALHSAAEKAGEKNLSRYGRSVSPCA